MEAAYLPHSRVEPNPDQIQLVLSVLHAGAGDLQLARLRRRIEDGVVHQDPGQRVVRLARQPGLAHLEQNKIRLLGRLIAARRRRQTRVSKKQSEAIRFQIDQRQGVVVQARHQLIAGPAVSIEAAGGGRAAANGTERRDKGGQGVEEPGGEDEVQGLDLDVELSEEAGWAAATARLLARQVFSQAQVHLLVDALHLRSATMNYRLYRK